MELKPTEIALIVIAIVVLGIGGTMRDVEHGLAQTAWQTGGERFIAQTSDQCVNQRLRFDGVGAVSLGGILAPTHAAEDAVVRR